MCWGDWGFGKKVAGTYLMWAEWPVETEPAWAILLTIDAEGTFVTTSSAALGRGDPEVYMLRQNYHGTWERTGWREITSRHILFLHDAAGNLVYMVRTTGVWTFDHDFEEFNVEFLASAFLWQTLMGEDYRDPNPNTEADPLGPPQPSVPSWGKRLHVE